jgi:hypothetical protein
MKVRLLIQAAKEKVAVAGLEYILRGSGDLFSKFIHTGTQGCTADEEPSFRSRALKFLERLITLYT